MPSEFTDVLSINVLFRHNDFCVLGMRLNPRKKISCQIFDTFSWFVVLQEVS